MGILDLFKKKNKKAEPVQQTEEKPQETEVSDSILKIIMNESIPGAQDQNNNPVFARDYKNRRIILSAFAFGNLVKNNELSKCTEYLKDAGKADFITLYWTSNNRTVMVNLNLKEQGVYFVPMNYDSDSYLSDISDETVHYTVAAAKLSEENSNKVIESSGKNMKFCAVKNKNSGEQYIPLFKTTEELRLIFPKDKYRISSMTYDEAVQFGKEFSGIVYRPTEENLILKNDEACLFTSISEFVKPYVDYRQFTADEKTIQDKIEKLQSMSRETEAYDRYYRGILQDIYDLDNLYVALNPQETDVQDGMGTPILSKKDGKPAIYLFSDTKAADIWTDHYKNVSEDGTKLIGVLNKKDNFSSIFAIAARLGVDLCMLDEGGSFLGFSIKLFMDVNNIATEINVRMTKEEADKLMNDKDQQVKVWFNKAAILGKESNSQKEYYELKMK